MSIFLEEQDVLHEVYFGRSSTLQKAQEVLGKWRSKYFDNRVLNKGRSDPLQVQFNELMAKQFGFHDFMLMVISSLSANAYTYSQSYSISGNAAKLKSYKDGFKLEGDNLYCVVYI